MAMNIPNYYYTVLLLLCVVLYKFIILKIYLSHRVVLYNIIIYNKYIYYLSYVVVSVCCVCRDIFVIDGRGGEST